MHLNKKIQSTQTDHALEAVMLMTRALQMRKPGDAPLRSRCEANSLPTQIYSAEICNKKEKKENFIVDL